MPRDAWTGRFGTELVVAPGAFDALSARLVEDAGFGAVYLSGGCTSVTQLGAPDLGVLAAADVIRVAATIVDTVAVPLIVDIDTGFGSPLNGYRTTRALRRIGVGAVQLEDQVAPKRCGHLAGKRVVAVDEFRERLAAVVDGAGDDMAVIARTDAVATAGLDDAIERGRAYLDAGADLVFVEAVEAADDFARVVLALDGRCVANMVVGGKSPSLTRTELAEMGYALAIFPSAVINGAIDGMRRSLSSLHETGTDAAFPPTPLSPVELFQLVGLDTTTSQLARWAGEPSDAPSTPRPDQQEPDR